MSLFASPDTLTAVYLPASLALAQDVTIAGWDGPDGYGVPDGPYRRVDDTFLGWLLARVEAAARRPDVDVLQLGRAIAFYHTCRDASGLTPAAHVPSDYERPRVWHIEATSEEKMEIFAN